MTGGSHYDRGFTLIEVLASLSIISVGTIVFITLFSTSLQLAQTSRNHKVAADLAESRLHDLMHNPGGYVWPGLEALKGGELTPVRPNAEEGDRQFAQPAAMPLDQSAYRREDSFYDKFSWDAYARLPRPNGAYVEATVVVRWLERGRDTVLALTSCVPRSAVLGKP